MDYEIPFPSTYRQTTSGGMLVSSLSLCNSLTRRHNTVMLRYVTWRRSSVVFGDITCRYTNTLLTLSNPGYFRQLTIRGGGGFKSHSPPSHHDLENYCLNLHHIIHVHFTRCFRHVLIGIFSKICDSDHFTEISK